MRRRTTCSPHGMTTQPSGEHGQRLVEDIRSELGRRTRTITGENRKGHQGRTFGDRYFLIEKIGAGGTAEVYRAYDETTGRKVAVKVPLSTLANDEQITRATVREAVIARHLVHPRAIEGFDLGFIASGLPYLVMELLQGVSLIGILDTDGHLNWREAKPIVLQLCEVLTAAHALGVVHKDLKPHNIFVVRNVGGLVSVKLIDFGLSQIQGDQSSVFFGGTPTYMAPEQAFERPVDVRADVYALAIVAYELLVGEVPFQGENAQQTLGMHMFKAVPPMKDKNRFVEVPYGVEQAVMKALTKNPDQRFQTMGEFAEALDRAA